MLCHACVNPLPTGAKYCPQCGKKVPPLPEVIRTKVYLHSSSESMYDKGQQLRLEGDALRMFCHGLDELECVIEVNTKTGEVELLSAAVPGRR